MPKQPDRTSSAAKCRARKQGEWGPQCTRKATTIWEGIPLCAQHEKLALRGDLDVQRDVVPRGWTKADRG